MSESYDKGRPRELSPLRFSILRLYSYMENLSFRHRELEGERGLEFLRTVLWVSPPSRESLDRKLSTSRSIYEESVFNLLKAIENSAGLGWRLDSVSEDEFRTTTAKLKADYLREKAAVDWRHRLLSIHFESVALQVLTGEEHVIDCPEGTSLSTLLTELAILRDRLWHDFSFENFDSYFRAAEAFIALPKKFTKPWQAILGRESDHRLEAEELASLKADLEVQMLWKEHTHG